MLFRLVPRYTWNHYKVYSLQSTPMLDHQDPASQVPDERLPPADSRYPDGITEGGEKTRALQATFDHHSLAPQREKDNG